MGSPQPGDIGLIRLKGIYGLAIRTGELIYDHNWREDHAFLYLGDGKIIEAQKDGADIDLLSRYDDRPILWSQRELTSSQRHKIVSVALSLQGIPYNWWDYGSLALWQLKIRPKWVETRVNDGSHLMCSQLCDRAWSLAGEQIFDDGRLQGDVTPGDLARQVADGKL